MVVPVPRRDLIAASKDGSAPPKLCDQSVHGTPPKPPPNRNGSVKRLNRLQNSCYIGVQAGAESPAPEMKLHAKDRTKQKGGVWMGSGFLEQKKLKPQDMPMIGG